jgi:hypothetical protein
MIPEEKAELAGLLEERMLRRELWPKIKLLPKTRLIYDIPVIGLPSSSATKER